jgi:23S rRNA pseudouridine2605 synthase
LSKGERLQKVLAAAGLGSRREIERWIQAGRLRIGDQVAKLGDRATPDAEIFLDEKPVEARAKAALPRVLAYHKPVGELVTRSDPGGRPTVFEKLPPVASGRWISVGRLDFNTSGLLLFTDSGELANQLMHPRGQIEREYEVRVQGGLDDAAIGRLLAGVQLDDGPARFLSLVPAAGRRQEGSNRWYRAVLAEGRKREVRRMVEAAGGRVSRLVRVRFGPVALPPALAPGRALELDAKAVEEVVRTAKSC